ncbi:MAG: GNAT family N-acetyltransferase [Hymenobacteraceae bacterium]|nr:GNAT family N-acetyltransferase [Hymenobacteraceae bacterium]MDX5395643.1 GNAT family N-acetyltransferase [Hymenobacteraceae bacterium]MDX5444364.1 GNAT family N-acetyltransferase [Hymenobacteraceae bacterium]MDX5511697.1 GNAT family N-acetyltransferase [Hymenobacteraceae bacterium]
MATYKTFETDRLYIRPTSLDDDAFLLELLNSPKWLQYIGDRNVHTVAAARKYIQDRILPQLEKLGFANYTLIKKDDQAKIGSCGLYDREGLDGVDIGFAFLPQYEKQGYAFEAASCIKQAAFDAFNLSQISAITTKNNLDSQNLLLKLGLTYQGLITIPNDTEELMLYRLLFTDSGKTF